MLPPDVRGVLADAGLLAQAERSDARICGSCKLCCTLMDVRERGVINKKAGQHCPKLCDAGCSVYETRPSVCRDWFCTWRLGFGSERPDVSGFIGSPADEISKRLGCAVMDLILDANTPPRSEEVLAAASELAQQGVLVRVTRDKRVLYTVCTDDHPLRAECELGAEKAARRPRIIRARD